MKRQNDPRHARRRRIVNQIFALSFSEDQPMDEDAKKIWDAREKTDPLIAKNAPEWPIEKLNKTDLAILRLAVYELVIEKKEPIKVIIDEAVELAKEIGGENSSSFVNGVLGTIAQGEDLKTDGGKN